VYFNLTGEPGSHVFGSISDGVFHGKITSPRNGAWYIEKSHYYFPRHELNDTLHSVIYHENDIEDPYQFRRAGKFLLGDFIDLFLCTPNSLAWDILNGFYVFYIHS
jgi:hypothetical protein